jgi:hypothetical protein
MGSVENHDNRRVNPSRRDVLALAGLGLARPALPGPRVRPGS